MSRIYNASSGIARRGSRSLTPQMPGQQARGLHSAGGDFSDLIGPNAGRDLIGPSAGQSVGQGGGVSSVGAPVSQGDGGGPPRVRSTMGVPNLDGLGRSSSRSTRNVQSPGLNLTTPGGNPRFTGPNTGLQAARDLLFREIDTLQGLENEQAAKLDATEGFFGDAIRTGMENAAAFGEAADRAENLGIDLLNETRRRQAVTEFGFENDSAKLASALTMGNDRAMQNQIAAINADPNIPDSVKQSRIQQLRQQNLESKSMTMAQAGSNFNSAMANIRMQGTSAIQSAGQLAQAGQQIANSIRGAGQSFYAQYAGMIPQLHAMQVQSPRSMVSTFAGISALMDMGATGGGLRALDRATGTNFGSPTGGGLNFNMRIIPGRRQQSRFRFT